MHIGIDVGGTHTDGVLIEEGRVVAAAKEPTDGDLLTTITSVLRKLIAEAQGRPISAVNLSTTLSTNAIVTGATEPVAVFVIPGPGIRAENYRIGDPFIVLPGAIDHRGTVTGRLRERDVTPHLAACKAANITAYAVVGKFSTRNPEHELFVADMLRPQAQAISLGHRMAEQLNFGRRVATAYFNSAAWRAFHRFAHALEGALAELGVRTEVNIVKADGGTMPLTLAREIPVQSIFSGPAASVMGILAAAPQSEDAIVLDIGGTTTDIALLLDGTPLLERDGITLAGHPTLVRALQVTSIALGGDSVVRFEGGAFRVGPDRLGPCMAAGGPAPALMDAVNVLGYAHYADTERSMAGIRELAMRQGSSVRECARQIVDTAMGILSRAVGEFLALVNSRPVYTIQEILQERRLTPKRVLLIGGPAKALAPLVETALELPALVPPHSPVANAIGACLTRPTQGVVLTVDTARGRFTAPGLGIMKTVPRTYTVEQAVAEARELLSAELARQGIHAHTDDIQVLQAESFNMVENNVTIGRNIRVRCQLRPGVLTTLAA
ncbi:MAG: hydantoinase/oxoprolinase family protein [Desulfomicrobiaceae bacterium]|nr:hydantoinase/oxoprolinase family protein [Desulfomicrobiaceae bacterium]